MSQYKAARNLVELTCKNCAKTIVIDAENPSDVENTAAWIQIVPANGERFATCSKICAIVVVQELPSTSGIVLVQE